MLETMNFRKDVMEKSARHGFTNATDAADYLVGKGVPFRDAHGIIGRVVLYCIDKGIAIDDMSLEELKEFSPDVFEEDIYDAISMYTCVNKRLTIGSTGQGSNGNSHCVLQGIFEKITKRNKEKGRHLWNLCKIGKVLAFFYGIT